jgi:hypothetical protein
MDSEHWISRLAAAKRYYAAQLGHVDGEDIPAFSCFSLPSVTSREAIGPGTDLRVLVGGLVADVLGMGTEEVEMEDDGDMEMEMEMALELGDATWPEVACPYCYEDHDVASLCVHLEEDHPYEPHAAVSQAARFFLQDSLL